MPEQESGLLVTRAEREAWLEEELRESTVERIRDGEGYYEIDEPYTLDHWKKLIEDLNGYLENPTSGCSPINPIDVPTTGFALTKAKIKEVREKIVGMCADSSFDWGWYLPNWEGTDDEKNLLIQPISKELIFELFDQFWWCGCNEEDIYPIDATRTAGLGECYTFGGESQVWGIPGSLKDEIDGMQVGSIGFTGRWGVGHETGGLSGLVNCRGLIEYGDNDDMDTTNSGIINWFCEDDNCVLRTTPPIWWFGPGWEEYNQEQYDICVAGVEERNAERQRVAQLTVDAINSRETTIYVWVRANQSTEGCEEEGGE